MVAAPAGDLYSPYSRATIEEGFQSSEEGSDLHSPIFEVSYPQEVRYPLGHHIALPDVHPSLVPSFDARFPIHDLSVQIPEPHLIGTLQVPSPTSIHHVHQQPHSHPDFALQQHSLLDMTQSHHGRHDLSSLSPQDEFSFNIPQTRLSEPLSISHEPSHPSSRRPHQVAPAEARQRPLQVPSTKTSVTSGGNNASTRPPRREASTAVIACRQCRSRKIRCDSTRPVCNNCTRRKNECEYDAIPKRRGPDKNPGTRQRSCKKRPLDPETAVVQAKKRRKVNNDHEGSLMSFDVKENVTASGTKRSIPTTRLIHDDASGAQIPQPESLVLETSPPHRHFPPEIIYPKDEISAISRSCSLVYDTLDLPNKPFARPIDMHYHSQNQDQLLDRLLPETPSNQYSRQRWWDQLLDVYADSRERSMASIIADLDFLLSSSGYWLSFIHKETFFSMLGSPQDRLSFQPALIAAALALATLMKSSEIELGRDGRDRALFWRDVAQASLEGACEAKELDYTLAEAALILALFESSAHPKHNVEHETNALRLMDGIIITLSLQFGDRSDPDASRFEFRSVPSVRTPPRPPGRCNCPFIPASSDPSNRSIETIPPWNPKWTREEIRKEECRRICWTALTLIANHTAHRAVAHQPTLELELTEPANYTLLFPGEAYERSAPIGGQSPKDSVWALYCRSMLLWNSCVRQGEAPCQWSSSERATFAINAWTETQAIQEALDMHQCNTDTALMYVCREFLYNTRMAITSELRRLADIESPGAPIFNRRQAEEWLRYQDQIAKRVKESVMHLGDTPGQLLSRRPFQVTWFSSQVALCLALWHYDKNLQHALELAKSFLIPLDALCALWPCEGQSNRRDDLRRQLENACNHAGIQPPLQSNVTLPPILRFEHTGSMRRFS